MKGKCLILLPLLTLLSNCTSKKIEITTEYIINENWNKIAKAIAINKMKVKGDSTMDLSNITRSSILSKLEDDSSFLYYANIFTDASSYEGLKVYFNKDNGFRWSTGKLPSDTTRMIGNLQIGTWYKFSRLLTHPLYVYVYVDSSNNVHRYDIDMSNY